MNRARKQVGPPHNFASLPQETGIMRRPDLLTRAVHIAPANDENATWERDTSIWGKLRLMQSTAQKSRVPEVEAVAVLAIQAAKRILAAGDYVGARQFVEQALVQSPNDQELQKLSRIIAPPEVRVSSSSVSVESLVANRQWLKEHSDDFQGQWVALSSGKLVGNAESLNEIKRNIGSLKGLFIKRIF